MREADNLTPSVMAPTFLVGVSCTWGGMWCPCFHAKLHASHPYGLVPSDAFMFDL